MTGKRETPKTAILRGLAKVGSRHRPNITPEERDAEMENDWRLLADHGSKRQ